MNRRFNAAGETSPRRSYPCVRGFTLIELVMVIVLAGVLAVYAVPRIFSSNDFYAKGFHDETLSILRYAQKSAIAQRRTVCVSFSSNSASLTIAAAAATPTCSGSLVGPRGESPATASARPGVAFATLPTNFNFDGLGQPVTITGAAQATQVIQITGVANAITVETGTGYVHE